MMRSQETEAVGVDVNLLSIRKDQNSDGRSLKCHILSNLMHSCILHGTKSFMLDCEITQKCIIITIIPQTSLTTTIAEECRIVPFNEVILQKTSEKMNESCKNPCKPDESYGKRLNEIIKHLPSCKSEEETKSKLIIFLAGIIK